MELESIVCPICETEQSREYLRARDWSLLRPGEFRLVRCAGCGLVYVNPRPPPEEMRQYYTADYWVAPEAEADVSALGAGFRLAVAALVSEKANGRVLDVGCGAGRQAAAMKQRGLTVVGIDPYEGACSVARGKHGIEALCATLQGARFPPESFRAVTFFDVLEHCHDPLGDLREALRVLEPGGLVVVKAPSIDALQARLLGKWWYLEVPRHLFHFSARSLRRLSEKAGFAPVSCRAVFGWRFGAALFETSVLHWLRAVHLRRQGVAVKPAPGQTVGEALHGLVYPGVPSAGKRAFRWFLRNVVYLPVGLENLVGWSAELLLIARKPGPRRGAEAE